MIRLTFFRFVNRVAKSVVCYTDKRITEINVIEYSDTKNNVVAIFIFAVFVSVFTIIQYNSPNVQDTKHEKKIVVKDDNFDRMSTFFPWLNYETYTVIVSESKKNNIDPAYVMSVIQYESGDYCKNNWKCMQRAVSRSGARGPMQIMPFHAKNPDDLFGWKYNIKKGAWYLGACMESSGGNIREAARKYNQGIHGNRKRYRNWPYVRRIARKYKQVLTKNVMAER